MGHKIVKRILIRVLGVRNYMWLKIEKPIYEVLPLKICIAFEIL
jgi:hypothetical protein